MSDNRRKILLISRKFQMTLIAKVAVVNIIAGSVFGVILYFAISGVITQGYVNYQTIFKKVSDMLLPLIIFVSISSMVFTVIASAYIVLAASNKISGPLYRLNQSLKQITDGDLSQGTDIRDSDETRESRDALDLLRKSLWNDLSAIKENIEIVKQKSGRTSSAEIKKAVKNLEKTAGRYRF